MEAQALETLADRLKHAREQARKTQTQLAEEIGVSRSAISQIEKGHTREIHMSTLAGLEKALGVRGDWLTTGVGAMRAQRAEFSGNRALLVAEINERLAGLPTELQEGALRTLKAYLSMVD